MSFPRFWKFHSYVKLESEIKNKAIWKRLLVSLWYDPLHPGLYTAVFFRVASIWPWPRNPRRRLYRQYWRLMLTYTHVAMVIITATLIGCKNPEAYPGEIGWGSTSIWSAKVRWVPSQKLQNKGVIPHQDDWFQRHDISFFSCRD